MFWYDDSGDILVDATGKPFDCPDCPCEDEPDPNPGREVDDCLDWDVFLGELDLAQTSASFNFDGWTAPGDCPQCGQFWNSGSFDSVQIESPVGLPDELVFTYDNEVNLSDPDCSSARLDSASLRISCVNSPAPARIKWSFGCSGSAGIILLGGSWEKEAFFSTVIGGVHALSRIGIDPPGAPCVVGSNATVAIDIVTT